MRHLALALLLGLAGLAMLAPAARAADVLFPADAAGAAPLKVTLRLPLRSILKARPGTADKHAGELQLEGEAALTVSVSPRGKSRREHCSFPPLWLDFKKKSVEGTIFAGQNKLKLVTHCSVKFASREYLATEMLAYRLFRLFTEDSFRVRAVQITYVDSERDREETRFAFLLEHKKRLADRLGGAVLTTPLVEIAQLEPRHAALLGVFQYMIGNTDFSMRKGPADECCHNAVPITAQGKVKAVPYDLDVTGLVNPPYAVPSQNLRIRRVTQRLYRGYCQHNELLADVAAQFADNKALVLAAVNGFDDIPGLRRERASKYLAGFFEVIESPRLRETKLVKQCLSG